MPPIPTPTTTLLTRGLPTLNPATLNPYNPVSRWLFLTAGSVAGVLHVGGVTRLTKSGLSMTDWKPGGERPPLTHEEWVVEFERYKLFPEWEQRRGMTLDEFKFIYFWEWGHRMLGRTVGLIYALPWAYFAYHKLTPPGYSPRLRLLFAMGGTQGLVGWWMVRSGLGDHRRGDRNEIRVSPYRLATHLGMAVSTYGLLLWTALGVTQYPNDVAGGTKGALSQLQTLAKSLAKEGLFQHASKLRTASIATTSLSFLTILSGAFVAGNDAGNAYNTFPKMDHQWIPTNDMIDPELTPVYRNLAENTATVQWNHRVLGTTTALSALTLAGTGLATRKFSKVTTPQVRRGLGLLGTAAVGQMGLGVATLLNYVPLGLAAAHQLGSLVVLSSGIYLVHGLRYAGPGVLRGVVGRSATTGVVGSSSGGVGVASGAVGAGKQGVGVLANAGLGMTRKNHVVAKVAK